MLVETLEAGEAILAFEELLVACVGQLAREAKRIFKGRVSFYVTLRKRDMPMPYWLLAALEAVLRRPLRFVKIGIGR